MFKELPDRWIFGIRDRKVVQAEVRAGTCRIEFMEGFVISADVDVQMTDASTVDLPHAATEVAEDLTMLVGTEVASAVAFKSGMVRLVFRPGYHVVMTPRDAERIVIRQSGQFEWIGQAGKGEMAVWSEEPQSR
ncbi:DUF6188 family protein [Kribbella sp. NBC_00482]|uniref:DUF6188 family protein n=1 Tax=Kribbella sp. NBC_00482 TaxID=2975968 RepID=UPI002E19D747